jgi:DnaJ-class molecular chaperone
VLGLQPDASAQAVRQAYKQLAARLHPDKWVLGTPEQRAAAEEQFKQVAAAYQSIMAF